MNARSDTAPSDNVPSDHLSSDEPRSSLQALTFPRNGLDALGDLARHHFHDVSRPRICGTVAELAADYCRVRGISKVCEIDDVVRFETGGTSLLGQIVRIGADDVTVKPMSSFHNVRIGTPCHHIGALTIAPSAAWKGRTINALAEPIDDSPVLDQGDSHITLQSVPPPALSRARVKGALATGIKVIDIFAPLCRGQRIGIFAGSGVGKSTLLRMLASASDFDTVVIALVGERGREVREFLEDSTSLARERTITVVSTSDESSVMRRLAPVTATAIAEHFRDAGENVLLIVDSITRFAHAARDAAMAAGEPPIARGYTPSVFADLVRLLERAGPGASGGGNITGVYSVLVDGDDHDEPIADTIRGTLDGHIVLDRQIAQQGRYPAVDPMKSLSRLAPLVWSADQKKLVASLRAMIARYEECHQIQMLGSHKPGADQLTDQAMELVPRLYEWLEQAEDAPRCADAFRAVAEQLASRLRAPQA